jgi:menaquinone-dependent protoporphyrinogen oxidase
MRVLITAASRYGATGEIAEAIGRSLADHGHDVTVMPASAVTGVDAYDAVVLGSAVYAGHWLDPAKQLVARHGHVLRARQVWLFSSGPIGDPPKPDDDPEDVAGMVEATGARAHQVFAGRIDRARLRLAERAIVRALRVPEGDFRDWDAIAAWATGIAAQLDELRPSTSTG